MSGPRSSSNDRAQPRELAEVRVAALPVAARQHREVVVVLDEDALAEELQREPGRALDEPLVALQERTHEAAVVFGQIGRQRALDALEDRALLGICADKDERVVRDSDEGRRENREQRLVVVAVLEQAQVVEQVDDLLLAEIAAAGHADRRQVDRAQLLFEPLGIGSGREEEDDLAGRGGARVDELTDATGDVPRLGAAPLHPGVGVRGLVGDEQLEWRAEDGIAVAARRRQLLKALAELVLEQLVDRSQHFRPRAVVERQRQHLRRRLTTVSEHRDVCVAEAVDRLELVADEEQLLGRDRRTAGRRDRSGGCSCPGTRRP